MANCSHTPKRPIPVSAALELQRVPNCLDAGETLRVLELRGKDGSLGNWQLACGLCHPVPERNRVAVPKHGTGSVYQMSAIHRAGLASEGADAELLDRYYFRARGAGIAIAIEPDSDPAEFGAGNLPVPVVVEGPERIETRWPDPLEGAIAEELPTRADVSTCQWIPNNESGSG